MSVIKIVKSLNNPLANVKHPRIAIVNFDNESKKIIFDYFNKLKRKIMLLDLTLTNFNKENMEWFNFALNASTAILFNVTDLSMDNKIQIGYIACRAPYKAFVINGANNTKLKLLCDLYNIAYFNQLSKALLKVNNYLNEMWPLPAEQKFDKLVKTIDRLFKKEHKTLLNKVKAQVNSNIELLRLDGYLTKINKKQIEEYRDYLVKHIYYVVIAGSYLVKFVNYAKKDPWKFFIKHDVSKITNTEFVPYLKNFYSNKMSTDDIRMYKLAWIHHVIDNPHHWNHFLTVDDSYDSYTLISKSIIDLIEMMADWLSVGYIYNKTSDIRIWASRTRMILTKDDWDFLMNNYGLCPAMFEEYKIIEIP